MSYQTGQPLTLNDSGVPDYSDGVIMRPRLTGTIPQPGPLVSDSRSPNTFLYLPVNQVYDAAGKCIAGAAPFACEISVNGPFKGTLGRNAFRQPGLYFGNAAVIKNLPLRNDMSVQLRAELYNVFNHPNLYINSGTNDVYTSSFNLTRTQTTPGVTAAFRDNRQIVAAVKVIF
jgi:hypothetical protein